MRVYYDHHGRVRGYSVPLWLVVLKWMFIIGVICSPIYGLFSLFGAEHSTACAVVMGVWLVAWLLLFDHAKSRERSRR